MNENKLMTRAARTIVDQRRWILIIFAVLCAVSVYTGTLVVTNDSLEHFLPADTETRQGLDIMDEEFVTYDTAQIVVRNISFEQALSIAEEIESVENVKKVEFDDSEEHYEGLSGLFEVTFTGANDDPTSKTALDEIEQRLEVYDLYVNTKVGNPLKTIIDSEMLLVDIIAFVIIILVLLLTSRTYGEIPVLLLTFGAAALLNMGTNFLMGDARPLLPR